jgi:hypothetical protein
MHYMADNQSQVRVNEAPRESEVPSKSSENILQKDEKLESLAAEGHEAVQQADIGAEEQESSEAMGNVSESATDKKDKKGDGVKSSSAGSAVDPKQIKAQLLKNLPTDNAMRQSIEKEIKKEIKYLHKKATRMLYSPGEINYFEMNNLMRKIRELKNLLVTLAKASIDHLKTLWLRFVHGVM